MGVQFLLYYGALVWYNKCISEVPPWIKQLIVEIMGGGEKEDHCVQHPTQHNVQQFEGTCKEAEESNTNSEKEITFVKWPCCWVQFPSVLFSFHFSVNHTGTNLLEKTDIIQENE